jgi:hypothetical protein
VPPEGFLDPSNWSHIVELPHNANQDDIAEWDGCFSDCVSGITLVEGELWRAVPDPLVVVYRNTSGWQTSVSHEVSFSQDLHKFHFPADRWEEAQDFCRQLARNTNRPVFAGGFVYDPSWVPMRDTDFAELREIASRQVSHINRNTSARAKIKTIGLGQIRPKLTWNDLPTELFNIYVALRNVLDVPAALFGEAEASTAVEYFERLLRLSDLPGLSWLALQPDAVRAHIEKWAARPIEFPLQLRTAGIRP